MQEPQPNIEENRPQPQLPQRDSKDKIPFFYKIIVTTILALAVLSILRPDTRRALANLSNDIFYKGEVWRLFTTQFVTFGAVDCIFTVIFAYMSIGRFEKRVGSAVFIVDFILIGFLIAILSAFINFLVSLVADKLQDDYLIRNNSGFFGMWFFYLSRLHYLQPDRDLQFLCFVFKQRNFPPLMFMTLLAVTSFKVPLIITVAYLLVITQDHCFKNRFFTFNFTFYIRVEKILRGISKRQDFYRIQQCGYSLSFFNNLNELRRLFIEAQRLLQNVQNINAINVIYQNNQNFGDEVLLDNNPVADRQQQNNHAQNNQNKTRQQIDESLADFNNDSLMEIKVEKINDEQFEV